MAHDAHTAPLERRLAHEKGTVQKRFDRSASNNEERMKR
jgi:hypothetical protein